MLLLYGRRHNSASTAATSNDLEMVNAAVSRRALIRLFLNRYGGYSDCRSGRELPTGAKKERLLKAGVSADTMATTEGETIPDDGLARRQH